MEESDYKIEHKFATKNFEKVTSSIPKKLIQKEEKQLEHFIKNKRNSHQKLKLLYDFMGSLYSHVNKNTPCKNGCNHCCHYNVSISELEVEFVESETKKKGLKV